MSDNIVNATDASFEAEVINSEIPVPVSYTHLTLPTNREV